MCKYLSISAILQPRRCHLLLLAWGWQVIISLWQCQECQTRWSCSGGREEKKKNCIILPSLFPHRRSLCRCDCDFDIFIIPIRCDVRSVGSLTLRRDLREISKSATFLFLFKFWSGSSWWCCELQPCSPSAADKIVLKLIKIKISFSL